MKAVLLENHPLLRAGLGALLKHPTLGLEVVAPVLPVGEPGDVHAVDTRADLLVIGLDEADGPVDTAQLREAIACSEASRVVLLAARLSAEEAHVAMTCGVDAYAAKSQPPEVLLATLQLVLAGGQSYPALMPRPAATAVTMLALDASEAAQRLNVSLRQYEVLVLLSRGHSVKGVGRLLGISEATVKTHACTLYRRLNVRNKSEAVYAAMRLGIPLELQGTAMAQGETTAAVQEDTAVFVQTAAGPSRASASTSMSATDAVMSAPRVAVADHGAESRWAAMTRAFGGVTPAKPPRPHVRTANGTARLG
ncbi:response regulator transcription factor [Ralstonia insidiosa]|uniref:LuxR family transcriptional regulator n=1 Tax=Ralstonia insidiosa TaxID=190721 RepID=A0A192A5M4_9RALS|nr:response regulator transcription factor [Ralstonia insidiosa]ANJ75592.1 LuxR family transcriptional regulator [Ralstonia insidiosa]KAB0469617.1 response regulator transcription factor [Ralstonia insidiosa]MBY4910318.1 response regulator transcription factor [Ralstonia insidiosa]